MIPLNFNRLITRTRSKTLAAMTVVTIAFAAPTNAHHPDRECQTVTPRIDLIGPIGNRLPAGHRRTYNRPSYLQGKIAYLIAPSSQEAMAWHRAVHAGAYESPKNQLRLEQHYFYPKPWEALTVGPRRSQTIAADSVSATAPMIDQAPNEVEMPEQVADENTGAEPTTEKLETELEVPAEPLELNVPPLDDSPKELLPPPEVEPQLELPEIELDEAGSSPSDAVKLPATQSPSAGKVPASDPSDKTLVTTVSGEIDVTKVSRATRVTRTSKLDVMEQPLFFRLWMTK
ncbi:MAG: hypothetical protein KDB00_18530 [Planctomycetales bacterium]|nr:hypothetical protein [Planctomycetales bacterium]